MRHRQFFFSSFYFCSEDEILLTLFLFQNNYTNSFVISFSCSFFFFFSSCHLSVYPPYLVTVVDDDELFFLFVRCIFYEQYCLRPRSLYTHPLNSFMFFFSLPSSSSIVDGLKVCPVVGLVQISSCSVEKKRG